MILSRSVTKKQILERVSNDLKLKSSYWKHMLKKIFFMKQNYLKRLSGLHFRHEHQIFIDKASSTVRISGSVKMVSLRRFLNYHKQSLIVMSVQLNFCPISRSM